MDARRRSSMRGFTLLEAVVSIAILAAAVLALASALLGSTHETAQLISRQTLTDVDSDVLTDLRVSDAYQPEVMDAMYAHPPQPFTVSRHDAAGDPVSITVSERMTPLANAPGYRVTVVATAADGHSEALSQTVAQQAVAPGSIVTQAPTSAPTSDSTQLGTLFGPAPAATFAAAPLASASPVAFGARAGCIDAGSCYPRPQPVRAPGR